MSEQNNSLLKRSFVNVISKMPLSSVCLVKAENIWKNEKGRSLFIIGGSIIGFPLGASISVKSSYLWSKSTYTPIFTKTNTNFSGIGLSILGDIIMGTIYTVIKRSPYFVVGGIAGSCLGSCIGNLAFVNLPYKYQKEITTKFT